MLEREYQAALKKTLIKRYPGCVIIKNNPNLLAGVPDLLILFEKKWAVLEVKKDYKAERSPAQIWRVKTFNKQSFAAFLYPEIEEEVLNALDKTFGIKRATRVFEPQ